MKKKKITPKMVSWKPEVFVEGKWSQNGLAFATEDEAAGSARSLMMRWFSVQDSRAVQSDQPVNYKRENNQDIPLS